MSPARRRATPLPIRDGLNASRVRCPEPGATALALITAAVEGQQHRHPDDDAAAIARRFADGLVVDNKGRAVAPHQPLKPGTDLWFYRIPAPEPQIAGPMPIIYSDADLVIVDKPPFLATTPRGRHITETALVRLRRHLDEPDLVPAHRLDRLTSGVLVFVRRPEARRTYQQLFTTPGAVLKIYEALAPTPPTPICDGTEIATRQDKVRGVLQAFTVPGQPNARTVIESVRPLAEDPQVAVWRLRPLTGRTHQLRLHLCELGCPIIGDPLYPTVSAVADEDPTQPMHLVCREMRLTHPDSGDSVHVRASRQLHVPTQQG
ncbi:hypothetical protein KRX51_09300 [Corynebacterium sp. TAE3-ERU12]|uniref:pseudouridine synthase n=1 Tax=Corynebacterium sp. TAE3-ERU12 TaxID=2849491 RepID=UPI001C493A0D|nr:pseudouridine synthase [Corynebacterium sp. TAE3-ERU12]MBV7296105.1 hypothetical protein [Corynebacterium sp. TAE3-ERU12]